MADIKEILLTEGGGIVEALKRSIRKSGKSATGAAERSLRTKVEPSGIGFKLTIDGVGYISNLETGVPPKSDVTPDKIGVWREAKGLNIQDADAFDFNVSQKIFEEGDTLYREGGDSGVISDVINDNLIDRIIKIVADAQLADSVQELVKLFGEGDNRTAKEV